MKRYTLILLAFLAASCGGVGNQNDNQNPPVEVIPDTSAASIDSENANKVLESLPASHEIIALLVDHPDAMFDATILNSETHSAKYNTSMSRSLNLGVYGVDMSYASLFNQNQTVIKYMAVVKIMAEQLGVLKFFDDATMQKMEQNMDNKEMMIEIISNAFYDSDKYLLENGQHEIAAMIISGAWIEAMYTAFNLTKGKYRLNPPLSSRILKQCKSIDLMINFLSEYKDGGVGEINADFLAIQSLINQANISIKDDLYFCSDNAFKSIRDKIAEIRARYVAL
ncbi:MAG: hypothetical protein J6T70_07315 [Bacteroidales bacterium]|nr:hypothetical protein [Bacteroidales bacterium]